MIAQRTLNFTLGMTNSKSCFTITERILVRWLVESYGLWEYRPWKWRNIIRETSQETENKCYCKKQIDHNFTWSTLL